LIATCIGNFVEWYDFAIYGIGTSALLAGLLLTRETAFQSLDGERVKEGDLITNR
jgi:hypothetical protein